MNIAAALRILFAGLLAAMATIAVAQSSANFKSPAFSVNAGVGNMGSASFSARASVGHPFGPAALSSTNFSVATGLLAIPLTTGTTGNLPVFNTGVAANGSLLPGGSVDPHYTLISSAEPSLPGPNAIVTSSIADGYWIPQGPNSKWIAPSANQSYASAPIPCNAAGTYTYRTLIDLTGLDPATAVIQGQWAADNQGTEIRLNGVSIDLAQPGYSPFVAFNINSDFVAGANTLDFVTSDQGCPNGLRVEFLSATASIATGGPLVPGAPTNLMAVAGNAQATFTFTAPASNGGSPITSYVASCGGPPITASASSSPITVTGLTNGVTYGCSVRAINAIGQSAASAGVTVTPVAPAPSATYAPAGGLNFGNVPVGSTSTAQTVTFTNTSAVTLTLNSVSFTGGGSGFNVLGSSQCLAQSTLASGASCTFDITVTPGMLGAASDTVRVVTTPANVATPANVSLQVNGVAAAVAVPFAYITNQISNNVSVIDTLTNTVVATIPVGSTPRGVAGNPSGTRVYVTNFTGNDISVIDTATNTVTTTIAAGNRPFGIAVNPAGTYAYVANALGQNVSVIDTATNTIVATVVVGLNPVGVGINPAGTRVYVTNANGNSVSVINTATNVVVATIPVSAAPQSGVAFNPSGTRAYVGNTNGNSVSVIDTATNTVVASVPVGSASGGPLGVTVTPDGSRLYVAIANGNVAVINTASNTVVGNILVGSGSTLWGIAAHPAGARVFVVNNGGNNVAVIDTSSNTVIATVAVGTGPVGAGQFFVTPPPPTVPGPPINLVGTAGNGQATFTFTPPANNGGSAITFYDISCTPTVPLVNGAGSPITVTGLTNGTTYNCVAHASNAQGQSAASNAVNVTPVAPISPAGSFAYITNQSSDNVSVINTSNNTVVATIALPTGSTPYGVAVNVGATRAYVTGNNSIAVIDTLNNSVATTVPVGAAPQSIAINPAGTVAYVGNYLSNSVSVIDATNNTVTATIAVGGQPQGIAINSDGTRVYTTNQSSNNVSVINTATNAVTASVPVGLGPQGIAVNPAGTRVYVANFKAASGNTVSVIDTGTNSVATIVVGTGPFGVAVNPAGSRAYVTNLISNTVSVIDTSTSVVLTTVTVGTNPAGISVNPAGTHIYVANNGSNDVSVIDAVTYAVTTVVPVGNSPIALGNFIGGPISSVPDAPTIGLAVAGNGAATISFTPPASNGGSAITSYRVDCGTPAISVSGTSSPVTVTGLTNGTSYACVAFAINAMGASAASAAVNVTPSVVALPVLMSVVSRKTHGASGTYELVIDETRPIGGNVTVEPRIMGAGHKIVFKFDSAIANAGVLAVTDSTGAMINTAGAIASGNEVNVTLTGNLVARRVAISLTGINGGVNAFAALGFLLGDVNNSRNVNSQDTSAIKARSGQTVNQGNFQYDITASGRITAADVMVSKVHSGLVLQSTPSTLTLSPTSQNFGAVLIGASSAPVVFTINNNTGGTASGMSVALVGTQATSFSITANTCGATLAPGASCGVSVTFTPLGAAGSRSASLTVSGSSGGTTTASLLGTAILPDLLTISPTAQNFGSVPTGASSLPVVFTVQNSSGVTASGLTTTISGANAASFLIAATTCGTTLPNGSNCMVNVTFSPSGTAGAKTATLLVNGSNNGALGVPLSGLAIDPVPLTLSPTSQNFGAVLIGASSAPVVFTINNNTGGTASGMSVALEGIQATSFAITANTCGASLVPGASCSVSVTFTPLGAAGSRSASLTVAGSPGGTITASLFGVANLPDPMTISPTAQNFGAVAIATNSPAIDFTVLNSSGVTATGLSVMLAGNNASNFSITANTCGTTLANGTGCTVSVTFSPVGATGARTATLAVTSGSTGTITASLAGTATF